jgi:type I restriction enzyme S subunit
MGWPRHKLESLCEVFTDGDWIESKNQSSEGIRLIQTGNVGDGDFKDRRDKARFISEATFTELKCCEIYEGDCLVSRLPDPVGRSCILPATGDRMITAVDCTILRFKKEQVIPEFFNYYSQSSMYLNRVESLTSGATRKRISRKNLGIVEVPLPPIPEQKRIVAILDQAFADIDKARALTEQNLKNARELFESYLQQVFSQRGEGWVEENMNELFKIKHGYAFKSKDFVTDYDGEYPIVLTPGNYTEYGNLYFTRKNTKRCVSDYPSDFLFEKDDLTIVMTDLSSKMKILGKPAFIQADNVLHNQRIGKFEFLTDKVEKEYVYYFLLSGLSLNNIHGTATGATVRHTAPSRILNNKIPFPTSTEQQLKIATALSGIDQETKRLEVIYNNKLAYLEELKKSLLQKAFTGELTSVLPKNKDVA